MSPETVTQNAIGVILTVSGEVSLKSSEGLRLAESGSSVFRGDELITGVDGQVEVRFADDTLLSQGAQSAIFLDDYVYDEVDEESSDLFFKMGTGTFRMVTGKIAEQNPERFKIGSPLATIGIRGTITVHEIGPDGEKHGVEEIHSGKALLVQSIDGSIRQIASPRALVDIASSGLMSSVRVMTVAEFNQFQSIAPAAIQEEQIIEEQRREEQQEQQDLQGGEEQQNEDGAEISGQQGEQQVEGELPEVGGEALGFGGDGVLSGGEGVFGGQEPVDATMLAAAEEIFGALAEDDVDTVVDLLGGFIIDSAGDSTSDDVGDDSTDDEIIELVEDTAPVPVETTSETTDETSNETSGDGIDWGDATESADRWTGTVNTDYYDGRGGDDYIDGKEGNDTLKGGDGNDIIYGNIGDDLIEGGSGADTLDGGDGQDIFRYSEAEGLSGEELQSFSSADDTLDFSGENFSETAIFAAIEANDYTGTNVTMGTTPVFVFDAGGKLWYDSNGVDAGGHTLITKVSGDAVVASDLTVDGAAIEEAVQWETGAESGETWVGTSKTDYYNGAGGDDSISGKQGVDTLFGGLGDDIIDGGNGADSIDGGGGNDTIYGGQNADYIDGGADNDLIYGGQNGDTMIGGEGNDTVSYEGGSAVQVNLADGTVSGGSNTDTLVSIENVIGTDNNDALNGCDAPNSLSGGAGDDTLFGSGDADYLSGGTGDDVFSYTSSAEGRDTIADFVSADDSFYFSSEFNSNYTFINVTPGEGVPYDGQTGPADGTAYFVFDSDNGQLWYDPDGSAASSDHALIATVFGDSVVESDISVESGMS
ncbi:FecR domain-containing protein [Maridesulfovibrio salexigens]|uniref:Hemolysin-type calcium-binding region n=1 Tax=Maridesulfovibrio salexigens (strain ATCC 14822 / DSM 2638 / NCIMB 8403 / VKM B-1763) TaxID=526222 RepID=C6BZ35_MARSD|nr:FecR domain-containing protein [Maridesulfovibrio salexigens]ACS78859.1 Hemolysin-type calcium-binding region [Maridesulfovibrio salexigens DSM 2638]